MFDDEFVYIHDLCFDVGCFYLEFKKGRPKTALLSLLCFRSVLAVCMSAALTPTCTVKGGPCSVHAR